MIHIYKLFSIASFTVLSYQNNLFAGNVVQAFNGMKNPRAKDQKRSEDTVKFHIEIFVVFAWLFSTNEIFYYGATRLVSICTPTQFVSLLTSRFVSFTFLKHISKVTVASGCRTWYQILLHMICTFYDSYSNLYVF